MYNVLVLLSLILYWPLRTLAVAIGLCVIFTEFFGLSRKKIKKQAIILTLISIILYAILAFVFADYTASLTNGIFSNFP